MSGTSLDGIDGVLVRIQHVHSSLQLQVEQHAFAPFDEMFRQELLALNTPGDNELHKAALAGNHLARLYAQICTRLLDPAGFAASQVVAIGAHGQTVRHRPLEFDADPLLGHPAVGYTLQLNNPALLAELSGLDGRRPRRALGARLSPRSFWRSGSNRGRAEHWGHFQSERDPSRWRCDWF